MMTEVNAIVVVLGAASVLFPPVAGGVTAYFEHRLTGSARYDPYFRDKRRRAFVSGYVSAVFVTGALLHYRYMSAEPRWLELIGMIAVFGAVFLAVEIILYRRWLLRG
jgi:hypothetical protein